jgi:hypothetical protein
MSIKNILLSLFSNVISPSETDQALTNQCLRLPVNFLNLPLTRERRMGGSAPSFLFAESPFLFEKNLFVPFLLLVVLLSFFRLLKGERTDAMVVSFFASNGQLCKYNSVRRSKEIFIRNCLLFLLEIATASTTRIYRGIRKVTSKTGLDGWEKKEL